MADSSAANLDDLTYCELVPDDPSCITDVGPDIPEGQMSWAMIEEKFDLELFADAGQVAALMIAFGYTLKAGLNFYRFESTGYYQGLNSILIAPLTVADNTTDWFKFGRQFGNFGLFLISGTMFLF